MAVCNDNTSAVYYWRSGIDSGALKWVIRLQGGGWCMDEQTCANRLANSPQLTSSSQTLPVINDSTTTGIAPHQGITSSNQTLNPLFYNANHVYLWYCSSDSHLGNAISPWYWSHRGKVIVTTLIDDIHRQFSNILSNASIILITGDSAGGVGASNNVDYMVQLIKNHKVVPQNTDFRGFTDAGWFMDIEPYSNGASSFRVLAQNMDMYYNNIWDQDCMKYYGKQYQWKCFHAQYMVQFIKTNMIFHEFVYDSANLGHDGIHSINQSNSAEMDYIYNFRQTMQDWMDNIRNISHLFRPSCFRHEVEDGNNGGLTNLHIDTKNFTYLMQKWLNDPTERLKYVDICNTVNCNVDCQ